MQSVGSSTLSPVDPKTKSSRKPRPKPKNVHDADPGPSPHPRFNDDLAKLVHVPQPGADVTPPPDPNFDSHPLSHADSKPGHGASPTTIAGPAFHTDVDHNPTTEQDASPGMKLQPSHEHQMGETILTTAPDLPSEPHSEQQHTHTSNPDTSRTRRPNHSPTSDSGSSPLVAASVAARVEDVSGDGPLLVSMQVPLLGCTVLMLVACTWLCHRWKK